MTPTDTVDVNFYLSEAEKVAMTQGARLTPIRRHVYKCLLQSDVPLGAYDILDKLEGVGSAKPTTAYRTLDWLIDVGLVQKITSTSKFIATAHIKEDDTQHMALLLCETCGQAEAFEVGNIRESLGKLAKKRGFQEEKTVIEIIGRCAEHRH